MAGILGSLLPIAIVFGIFWFLVIRPQKQRQEERSNMLEDLQVGDDIVTIGGIKGEIKSIKQTSLKLQIAPDIEIEVTRQSIGRVEEDLEQENSEQEKIETEQ
ncbi:MAG: preprotein translocase subunit YajC [Bacillota bacterium]